MGAPRDGLSRAKPQAGLADPVCVDPRQPEWNRPRLARAPTRWQAYRRAARPAPRDAADVARAGTPAPARDRPWRRGRFADLSPDRDRRVTGGRPPRGLAAPRPKPDR